MGETDLEHQIGINTSDRQSYENGNISQSEVNMTEREKERVDTLGPKLQDHTYQLHVQRGVYSGESNKLFNPQRCPVLPKMRRQPSNLCYPFI